MIYVHICYNGILLVYTYILFSNFLYKCFELKYNYYKTNGNNYNIENERQLFFSLLSILLMHCVSSLLITFVLKVRHKQIIKVLFTLQ